MTSNDSDALMLSLGQVDGIVAEKTSATNTDVSIQQPAPEDFAGMMAIGKQVARILEQGKYHPVMVVGAQRSGKTMLLASLLARAYATKEETSVDLRLGERALFPEHHPLVDVMWTQTKEFYEGTVNNFANGELAPATRFEHPFYIPIEVIPQSPRLKPVRFAFLECRGEVYDPQRQKFASSDRSYFKAKELPGVIAGVLLNFTGPLSIIYVAPGWIDTRVDPDREQIADLALLHNMERIQGARRACGSGQADRHLYLLSMWDELAGDVSTETFARPDPDQIETILGERFPKSWKKYTSHRAVGTGNSHTHMQYSVGPIVKLHEASVTEMGQVPTELWPVLNRYPRTVLNWLYTNASGEVLFPDVVEPPPPQWTLVDRFMQFVVDGSLR